MSSLVRFAEHFLICFCACLFVCVCVFMCVSFLYVCVSFVLVRAGGGSTAHHTIGNLHGRHTTPYETSTGGRRRQRGRQRRQRLPTIYCFHIPVRLGCLTCLFDLFLLGLLGLAWLGLFCLAWLGSAWLGLAWLGLLGLHGLAWLGLPFFVLHRGVL